jgi:predicted transcriptional regulator
MARDGSYKPAGASIVTIPVSPELHRRLRIHCASEGRTVKWVGTKALEAYLDWHDTKERLGVVEDRP